jgi:hypothetical protein
MLRFSRTPERKMIITICASMNFIEKSLDVKNILEKEGHKVFVSGFAKSYVGKTEEEKERQKIVDKNEHDAIREHWNRIEESDAIRVLNYDKKGIKNYVGGNTLLEMGFAYILNKKIFMLNPVPDIDFYKSEIESTKPIILNGDLSLLDDL